MDASYLLRLIRDRVVESLADTPVVCWLGLKISEATSSVVFATDRQIRVIVLSLSVLFMPIYDQRAMPLLTSEYSRQ